MIGMTSLSAISFDLVKIDAPTPASKAQLFEGMVGQLITAGRACDHEAALAALDKREAEGSTFMGNGIAIPHAKSSAFIRASVSAWRLQEPMHYRSHGEEGAVYRVFMLTMPEGAEREHLRALASVAQMLSHDAVLERFDRAVSEEQIVGLLAEYLGVEKKPTEFEREEE